MEFEAGANVGLPLVLADEGAQHLYDSQQQTTSYNSDYINNYHSNGYHNGSGIGTEADYNGSSLYDPRENNNINTQAQILYICFGIVYTLIGLAGSFGNGLVVYVFTRFHQTKEEGTNSFILSLSANDLMVSSCQFISVYAAFTQSEMRGPLGCGLYGALMGVGSLISTLTTAGIVLTQFCRIYGCSVDWWANIRTCKIIWALGFILMCPPFLGSSEFSLEGLGISCSLNWKSREFLYNYFYILLRAGLLITSTILLLATYAGAHKRGLGSQQPETRLVRTTEPSASALNNVTINMDNEDRRSRSRSHSGSQSHSQSHEREHSSQLLTIIHPPSANQHKMLQMVLIMVSCLVVSWLPYLILNMVEQFSVNNSSIRSDDFNGSMHHDPWPEAEVDMDTQSKSSPLSALALTITGASIFAKLSVICNPIIYILFHPEFRGLLVLSMHSPHINNLATYKHSIVPSLAENSHCDFRRPSSGLGLQNFANYNRANSIPGSRITPSNSICQSHASFNSHHSRYHRQSSTSQERSRSGSGASRTSGEMARSSITSGGRRPTISSSNTFRQVRTNSSCSSSSMAATLATLPLPRHHHLGHSGASAGGQWRIGASGGDKASQELLLNKFGWAIQRRPSGGAGSSCSGNSSTLFSPSRATHSKLTPKTSASSGNGLTKVNYYSEPDLPRFNDRIMKNAGLIPFQEYKRRKKKFWRKSLFLSENCLESLCSESKFLDRNSPIPPRSKTPSPTYSQTGSVVSFSFDKRRPSNFVNVNGNGSGMRSRSHSGVTNVLSVPMPGSSAARLSLTGNGKLFTHRAEPPSRSKSMRAPKTGGYHKFLELPARFKRHSDGGVCSRSSHSPSTSPTKSSNRKQSRQLTVDGFPGPSKERSNSRDHGQQRKESSIIMVTSPCGDTASVKLESFEGNELLVDNNPTRKFSEISSQYHGSARNSSKKLSFELGGKNEWKYSLVHQKECCDCSSSGCHQDQFCPSDLP